jgi:hypothetical protein
MALAPARVTALPGFSLMMGSARIRMRRFQQRPRLLGAVGEDSAASRGLQSTRDPRALGSRRIHRIPKRAIRELDISLLSVGKFHVLRPN